MDAFDVRPISSQATAGDFRSNRPDDGCLNEMSENPRVLHVLDHSLPVQSGYTFRTLAILGAQRSLGWETHHLTSPKQGPSPALDELIDGWRFLRTPSVPVRPDLPISRELHAMRATTRRLAGLVATLQPTVLHAHSPILNGYPALWLARRHRIPVIYEVRAFWEDAAVDQGTTREGDLRYRVTRALETQLMRRADAVVAICDGLRQDILARGRISAAKVTVAPNAVDASRFTTERHTDQGLRSRLGLQDASAVLGFIGSMYDYEGLEFLVRAFSNLLQQEPLARLVIIGGGPAEERVRTLVDQLGLAGRVVLLGRVPHGEVRRYYDLVDVFVYPRLSMRLTELVTPLKPLEAMASGRIVIASDVGGHRELIADGRTGFLFRAGDDSALIGVLRAALAHRERWPAVAYEARRHVERQHSLERLGEIYRHVMARTQERPTALEPSLTLAS
jgi:PEP-CTERM/exosortase A-associated glycosyltransferase